MRGIASPLLLGLARCCSGAAGAAAQDKEGGTVKVNGVRNPEMHTYRAIAAGLDTFDAKHALAPDAPQLLFQARTRSGKPLAGALQARLAGDDNYAIVELAFETPAGSGQSNPSLTRTSAAPSTSTP